MNIDAIESNQFIQPAYHVTNSNGPAMVDMEKRASSNTTSGLIDGSVADAQTGKIFHNIRYLKNQLDKLLYSYPPFFPPGSYQRLDLIRQVNEITADIVTSSLQSAVKQAIGLQPLTKHATDAEIGAAIQNLMNLKDNTSQRIPQAMSTSETGTILDITL
jgi:hypothetical protein